MKIEPADIDELCRVTRDKICKFYSEQNISPTLAKIAMSQIMGAMLAQDTIHVPSEEKCNLTMERIFIIITSTYEQCMEILLERKIQKNDLQPNEGAQNDTINQS
jgi:hypothetical protein